MKDILFCGGSHLAQAKSSIEAIFLGCTYDLYVTASGENREWHASGGRYAVDGYSVSGNATEPERVINLHNYKLVVFIGQFVQPQRWLGGATPYSKALLESMFPVESFLLYLPGKRLNHRDFYNEPLELFAKLSRQMVLCSDPFPWNKSYVQVPVNCKLAFIKSMEAFCSLRGIELIMQPNDTVTSLLSTKEEFKRNEKDTIHFNDKFWLKYISHIHRGVHRFLVSEYQECQKGFE